MDNQKILVVDDETAFLIAAKKLLDGLGFTITTAETFHEAMTLLTENCFHMVITDVRLSNALNKEGLDILRHIKEKTPGTIVIILTGYGNPDTLEKAYKLGANLYLEKPVSPIILRNIIENFRRTSESIDLHGC